MSKRLRTALLAVVILATLVAAPVATCAKEVFTNPDYMYIGKYQGAAVGGDGEPFPIIVYLEWSGGAAVEDARCSVVADKLGPFPLKVNVKQLVFDTPRTMYLEGGVNEQSLKLYGNGTANLVEGEDGIPLLYGRGEGSFQGKSGSGHGKARLVVQRGPIDQVIDAGIEAASPPSADEKPAEYPPRFELGQEVPAEPVATEAVSQEETPFEVVERTSQELFGMPMSAMGFILLFVVLLILLLFGIL